MIFWYPQVHCVSVSIRIGNASGFYGDRFSAVSQMLAGGPLDVLTGDYLAEITMAILGRDRMKDPKTGYAKTFLRQMEENLGQALSRGVKIVTNAGGLNPRGLAEALHELAHRIGLSPKIAYVTGDDLLDRCLDLGLGTPLTANAYLGSWGIAECLRAGADVVVTGRVTDASLVVGPAAAHFGWSRHDYDKLAAAVVAGHVLECGAQATGGNYSFFTQIPMGRLGFPIAEVDADGSCVITKHPGTGGAVTTGTVTAQLLYEITGAAYAGPDVTARFDSIRLSQEGADRVRITGVRGVAPPPQWKVGLTHLAGFRNEVTFVLGGLDVEAKMALLREQLEVAASHVEWTRHGDLLRVVVTDPDPQKAGRAFSSAAVELALASYPGFALTAPPSAATPYAVHTAAFVDPAEISHTAVLPDGRHLRIDPPATTQPLVGVEQPPLAPWRGGPVARAPLGTVAGARSGDKGDTANIGVWAKTPGIWPWLAHTLTVRRFKELMRQTAALKVTRHAFANLCALNFVVEGLLSPTRFDPQGKGLGEQLRSCQVEIPVEFL